MPIKVEVTFKNEVNLGWANGWNELHNALFSALSSKAKELGIKCEQRNIGRCCKEYCYPGVLRYSVDSSD